MDNSQILVHSANLAVIRSENIDPYRLIQFHVTRHASIYNFFFGMGVLQIYM